MLDAWDFGTLDGVVGIGSTTRPELLTHLTDGLARYLKLPVLTRFTTGPGPAPDHDVNSARRLAAVVERLSLDDPGAVFGTRVLLVDDRTDSGWTLTVAARSLRQAGATAVLPFVLGIG